VTTADGEALRFVIYTHLVTSCFDVIDAARKCPKLTDFRNLQYVKGRKAVHAEQGLGIRQTFWRHTDSGRMQFNYSEILGYSTAVAISAADYQDNRDAASAVTKLGTQIGVDLAANVLKEFSSDLNRKLFPRHHGDQSPTP
jgi:hypothetical protein